jgi:hypothetical protein
MGTITVKEMIEVMEKGSIFSITFVTYDKQRKSGGELRHYPTCKLTTKAIQDDTTKPSVSKSTAKNARSSHFEHSTRAFNVVIGDAVTHTVKKFHLFLVLEFNGKKLIL